MVEELLVAGEQLAAEEQLMLGDQQSVGVALDQMVTVNGNGRDPNQLPLPLQQHFQVIFLVLVG